MNTPPPKPRGRIRRGFDALFGFFDLLRRGLMMLFFLVFVGILLTGLFRKGPTLEERTTLVIDPEGPLVEQRQGNAQALALQSLQGRQDKQVVLRDLVRAIDEAAKDNRIHGALLLLDEYRGGGLASQREVTAALQRFRAAGKKVTAWGRNYEQRQYQLAAQADEVYLHPFGIVGLEGYGRLRGYYRDTLDKMGVKANVVRVGTYKNAAEPFFATGPSPATLESDKALYDGLWKVFSDEVEGARKLPAGSLQKHIDSLPAAMADTRGSLAELAQRDKLVDGLRHMDEVRALLIQRGAEDKDNKTFRQVNWAEYLGNFAKKEERLTKGTARVGVLVAEGEISDGDEPPGRIGGNSTARLLRSARNNEDIKALVLRVNSPGGSVMGSELVRRELELMRKAGKPVIVSMGDVAASGGYWISTSADEILADPGTITGSIGVFGMLPTAEELSKRSGVNTGGYTTGWLRQAYDPRRPPDPRLITLVQGSIDRVYEDFKARVAAARKITPEQADALGQGRVWSGTDAKAKGLVDRFGRMDDALKAARAKAKLPDDSAVEWIEREPSKLQRIFELLGGTQVLAPVQGWLQQQLQGAAAEALGPAALPALQTAQTTAEAATPELLRAAAWWRQTLASGQPVTTVHCLCSAQP